MAHSPRRILAVVDDLFFIVKIHDAAKRAGMLVEFLKSEQDLLDKALAEPPALVIVDLNCTSAQPLALIASLKRDAALKRVSVIAFVSHVQGELKMQAQDAGADMVLARSAFSINLPQILRRHAA
jgi:PleD family two-component response regulator